jgi:hypothetical protein
MNSPELRSLILKSGSRRFNHDPDHQTWPRRNRMRVLQSEACSDFRLWRIVQGERDCQHNRMV